MKNTKINYAAAFKALSNENRLKAFHIIRLGKAGGKAGSSACGGIGAGASVPDNAVCVCEILEKLNVTAPTLSHHLKELRNAGLVDVCHSGQWSYYSIREGVLETLSNYFDSEEPARKPKGGRR